ncbi:AAA family ATPase [Stutzerimonas zhaodongensis]|uniref:AAA family ATPase n=1 Tax=Stutzerimonas TaxID=2901164 RepID=UPI00388DCA8B
MILLIGIQAAGKSTFYRRQFFDTHLRLNLDMLRTRYRERTLFQACLQTQQRLVIDNTNPSIAERAAYIGPARGAGFRVIGYFFEPDPRGCAARNESRVRQIPPAGLFGTLKRLQRPTLGEGFDTLYRVVLDASGEFIISEYEG